MVMTKPPHKGKGKGTLSGGARLSWYVEIYQINLTLPALSCDVGLAVDNSDKAECLWKQLFSYSNSTPPSHPSNSAPTAEIPPSDEKFMFKPLEEMQCFMLYRTSHLIVVQLDPSPISFYVAQLQY